MSTFAWQRTLAQTLRTRCWGDSRSRFRSPPAALRDCTRKVAQLTPLASSHQRPGHAPRSYTRSLVSSSSVGLRRGKSSRTSLRSAIPSSRPTCASSAPLEYSRSTSVWRADSAVMCSNSQIPEQLAVGLLDPAAAKALLPLLAIGRDLEALPAGRQEQPALRIQAAVAALLPHPAMQCMALRQVGLHRIVKPAHCESTAAGRGR